MATHLRILSHPLVMVVQRHIVASTDYNIKSFLEVMHNGLIMEVNHPTAGKIQGSVLSHQKRLQNRVPTVLGPVSITYWIISIGIL